MTKNLIIALQSILILGMLVWWYLASLDFAISWTYREATMSQLEEENTYLKRFVQKLVKGRSQTDLEAELRELFPAEHVFSKEGAINVGSMSISLPERK